MAQPNINFLHMGMSAPDVALRFMGAYEAQFKGLRQAGATVTFSLENPDPRADVVICTANAKDINQAATQTKCPLILYVPPADQWFEILHLSQLRHRILFVYGPVVSQATTARYHDLGLVYHYLPFAADPDLMKPLDLPPQYDIVFLGGLQHRRGYRPYVEPLLRQLDPSRLLCIGGGWEKYGFPPHSIAYGALVNVLYNLARVTINFHAQEQCRGQAQQLDLNNRVFDLAMAGCLQVSDNPDAVRMHFGPDEMFAEATPEAWGHRVLDCLAKPTSEFSKMRQAARTRALAEHTWFHRGQTMLSWIHKHTH